MSPFLLMVAPVFATTFVVAAASALWRFSHLIDPPVPSCNVHYPEEFPSVTCHCEHETHCDVRCERYPLQEDGERTFLIVTSSVSAGFAAGVLAGAYFCRGRAAAGPVAGEAAVDLTRVVIHGDDRAQRPALAPLPY